MTASAAITVNGVAVSGPVAVLRNTTVTLALVSLDGADSVEYLFEQASESGLALPTLTPVGSPAVSATFPMPDRNNQAYTLRTTVNKGLTTEAISYTLIGVVDSRGRLPFVPDEELHRGLRGWADALNALSQPLYSSRFTSTNNTDTTILTIPMATDEQTVFDCFWHARDQTTNTDTFAKRMQVYARRNSSGIVVVVSSSTPLPNEAIDATWTGTAVSDGGTNLLIKAKGDSANSVRWHVSADPIFTTR